MTRFFKFILLGSLFVMLTAWGWGSKYETMKPENGVVKIPVKEVNDGKAHYYETKLGGKEIRYFLLRSTDGVVRAAFDACDVCYREKKGYSQQGVYMVCNNCGMRFHSLKINVVKGGCNPSPLKREEKNGYVYLDIKDIAMGSRYF
ncbi:DUF2318 domain-containing protein [Limisalsivibrio acetivorans]|uniref:DUF2318 domain-containing protein n=1 Tax=Limisalsivibrio acetivorans TaxID=1304888 RepID=UPI0003B408E6|nr:DUF2318 domain-containing protein [Limisalsivibrio acetivorans]